MLAPYNGTCYNMCNLTALVSHSKYSKWALGTHFGSVLSCPKFNSLFQSRSTPLYAECNDPLRHDLNTTPDRAPVLSPKQRSRTPPKLIVTLFWRELYYATKWGTSTHPDGVGGKKKPTLRFSSALQSVGFNYIRLNMEHADSHDTTHIHAKHTTHSALEIHSLTLKSAIYDPYTWPPM